MIWNFLYFVVKSRKSLNIINRKAFYDYTVEDTFEAGIRLTGAEVKSIRRGAVNLTGSHIDVTGSEAYVLGMNINPYPYARDPEYNPKRIRKLLLQRKEINRLIGILNQKGYTVVPLKMYLKGNLVKVQLGVCRGKKKYDKREALKRRQEEREVERVLKEQERQKLT